MLKTVVLAALLVGCGTDNPTPDAGAPQWSCQMFVDCAGSASVVERSVGADTETAAETQLVDECEQTACSGALACHAVCQMP